MDHAVTDLPAALSALADLGIHPVGLTVDRLTIAVRLAPADQAEVLANQQCRESIVAALRTHGFLHVTLRLDDHLSGGTL